MQGLVCKGISFVAQMSFLFWENGKKKKKKKESTVYLADEAGADAQGYGTVWQRAQCDGPKEAKICETGDGQK